jgi:GTP-binding protein
MQNIYNIAIIAHVDHGKTTLIDGMFQQSGTFRDNQEVKDRAMDTNALERERGITILAKCTSLKYKDNKINIIDTPGHADFGGEVERVLSMVDSVLLLVDASEGPMPQTKFVLEKALELGLKPLVVINKADKPDARIEEVLNETFDLFSNLGANEDQLDFPVIYASAKNGWANDEPEEGSDLYPLFEQILGSVPEATPKQDDGNFRMLASILDYDKYLGRILIGKVYSGEAGVNMPIKVLDLNNNVREKNKLTKLYTFEGLKKVSTEQARAGDIIAIAGIEKGYVADTICSPEVEEPLPSKEIDPPTMSISISVNDSPFAGTEGDKLTSRMIRNRLFQEAETNVAISISEGETKDTFIVGGRGELQLGILAENMRREGYELAISRPKVLYKQDSETGKTLEPIEKVQVDVDEEFSGDVIEKLSKRQGELEELKHLESGKVRLLIKAPSRGLIGYQSEFLTDTKGSGVMNKQFYGYEPYKGEIPGRVSGSIISGFTGEAVAYALFNLEDRGTLFIQPHDKVYEGMIIGENSREDDLEVNPLKAKQLTNVRASSKDESIKLSPPRSMNLEQAISYIAADELVEITPKNIRLRKRFLKSNERKKAKKSS